MLLQAQAQKDRGTMNGYVLGQLDAFEKLGISGKLVTNVINKTRVAKGLPADPGLAEFAKLHDSNRRIGTGIMGRIRGKMYDQTKAQRLTDSRAALSGSANAVRRDELKVMKANMPHEVPQYKHELPLNEKQLLENQRYSGRLGMGHKQKVFDRKAELNRQNFDPTPVKGLPDQPGKGLLADKIRAARTYSGA